MNREFAVCWSTALVSSSPDPPAPPWCAVPSFPPAPPAPAVAPAVVDEVLCSPGAGGRVELAARSVSLALRAGRKSTPTSASKPVPRWNDDEDEGDEPAKDGSGVSGVMEPTSTTPWWLWKKGVRWGRGVCVCRTGKQGTNGRFWSSGHDIHRHGASRYVEHQLVSDADAHIVLQRKLQERLWVQLRLFGDALPAVMWLHKQ